MSKNEASLHDQREAGLILFLEACRLAKLKYEQGKKNSQPKPERTRNEDDSTTDR